jgi:hypothetical protein
MPNVVGRYIRGVDRLSLETPQEVPVDRTLRETASDWDES